MSVRTNFQNFVPVVVVYFEKSFKKYDSKTLWIFMYFHFFDFEILDVFFFNKSNLFRF